MISLCDGICLSSCICVETSSTMNVHDAYVYDAFSYCIFPITKYADIVQISLKLVCLLGIERKPCSRNMFPRVIRQETGVLLEVLFIMMFAFLVYASMAQSIAAVVYFTSLFKAL